MQHSKQTGVLLKLASLLPKKQTDWYSFNLNDLHTKKKHTSLIIHMLEHLDKRLTSKSDIVLSEW